MLMCSPWWRTTSGTLRWNLSSQCSKTQVPIPFVSTNVYVSFFFTVSLKYYVLSGQHKFSASQDMAESFLKERQPVPKWCKKFRCNVIKEGTSLEDRQKIAGREQARQEGVQRQMLHDTVVWFLKEVDMAREKMIQAHEPVVYNKLSLLKTTYLKTGKSIAADGSMVCQLYNCLHIPYHHVLFHSQDNWCKSMYNLAELCMRVPERVVELVKFMEQDAKPSPNSFKCLEGMVDTADFVQLVNAFLAEPKKTVDKLRFWADKIIKARWWKWNLLHPDLGPDHIHVTRSMSILTPLSFVFTNDYLSCLQRTSGRSMH